MGSESPTWEGFLMENLSTILLLIIMIIGGTGIFKFRDKIKKMICKENDIEMNKI